MFQVTESIQIPDEELVFTYARSGGPGGQNVNKVASKAVLRWSLATNSTVPAEVKARLRTLQRRRITVDDEIVIQSQEHRDQELNRQACLEKLRELLTAASFVPKARRATKPSKGAKRRRLEDKRQRSAVKSARKPVKDE